MTKEEEIVNREDTIIDVSKLTDKELLVEFADRFIKYDQLRDKLGVYEGEHPNRESWDNGMDEEYENLHMEVDNAFCRMREIVRYVKNDNELLAC